MIIKYLCKNKDTTPLKARLFRKRALCIGILNVADTSHNLILTMFIPYTIHFFSSILIASGIEPK